MAYNELIKKLDVTRNYLRFFYVYGFKHRVEFEAKSPRTYDNEKRRLESWFEKYMRYGQDPEGRRYYFYVDSRAIPENPLYRAFEAQSFTDKDIALHFHLLDILETDQGKSLEEIQNCLHAHLTIFEEGEWVPDEKTVRNKLREYINLGLLRETKNGKKSLYWKQEDEIDLDSWKEALAFFTEVAPVGVVGSFLGNRLAEHFPYFRFKHHYLLNALDSEIMAGLLEAMEEQCLVSLEMDESEKKKKKETEEKKETEAKKEKETKKEKGSKKSKERENLILPLKIYIGTQSGRQYLLYSNLAGNVFSFIRLDNILKVNKHEKYEKPEGLEERLEEFTSTIWGVSKSRRKKLNHLEMTILVEKGEDFIRDRLEREKRMGRLEDLDETHVRFTVDLYDCVEIVPWIRSFMGRITDLTCTEPEVEDRVWGEMMDLEEMYG